MSLLFLLYQLFVFGVRNGYQPYDYFLNNDTRSGHCEIPLRSQDNWSPELFGKKLQQQDLLIVLSSPYVGQDTKMPDYLILISTLGGISWFGLSGFVIGPIIAALFITVWQMVGKEFGQ